jgi:hypothetical protein
MFPRALIQKHAGSTPKIIYLPIPYPIITSINTPHPFSQTQNLPAIPKSSVQEKRVRIFGNQPYSMRLSILHIFDLLVSRIFGRSRTFLFQCIRSMTPLIPLYTFDLDYFVNGFPLEISHLVTPLHQLSTPSSPIQFIEPL